jgi:hypothetical protein
MMRLFAIWKALFKRWLYLLFIGMWRGECAWTYWERGRLKAIASGRIADKELRVWWSEK